MRCVTGVQGQAIRPAAQKPASMLLRAATQCGVSRLALRVRAAQMAAHLRTHKQQAQPQQQLRLHTGSLALALGGRHASSSRWRQGNNRSRLPHSATALQEVVVVAADGTEEQSEGELLTLSVAAWFC